MSKLILGSRGLMGSKLREIFKERNIPYRESDLEINHNSCDLRVKTDYLDYCFQNADFVYFFAFDVGGSKYLESKQRSKEYLDNNIKIMLNAFDYIHKYNLPFLYVSSQMSNMVNSDYGALKLVAEKYVKALGGILVKLWNVYGAEEINIKSHVINDFIDMAKNQGVIKMRTNGEESRQFLYVDDAIEAFQRLVQDFPANDVDVRKEYHITNYKWTTIYEIAEIIASHFKGCKIERAENTDGVQMDKKNKPNDEMKALGWKPKTSLKEGIKKIIDEVTIDT